MIEVTIDAEATEALAERLFQAALGTVDISVCGLRPARVLPTCGPLDR